MKETMRRNIIWRICLSVCVMVLLFGVTGCHKSGIPELLVPSRASEEISSEASDLWEQSPDISEKGKGSLWKFSHALLAESLAETNPVLSPVSAYLALGMTGLGASGETLTEFESVMGTDMHEVSARLIQKLPVTPQKEKVDEQEAKLYVNLANSVWVDTSMEPAETWLQGVNDQYQSEVYRAELSGGETMKRINSWIKEETFEMIPKFLEEPLSEDTRLALFNTIYFYGEWQQKFKESDTYAEAFTKEDGKVSQVEMMHDYRSHCDYVSGGNYDGVVLPYRDGNIAFVALKPTAGQSVREMYQGLSEETVQKIRSAMKSSFVNLKLPKFEVTFDTVLNENLQNMGMKRAFDAELADFSAMGSCTDGNGLYISTVRQKAVMKLNEDGTEAAAVTMVVMTEGAALEGPEKPIDVFFDRPFLYMIVDLEEEVPLFMGIMDDPEVCQ